MMADTWDAIRLPCPTCPMEYLTDPREAHARLVHLPNGRHLVVLEETTDMDAALQRARVEALSLAVRLDDLRDDLAQLLVLLDVAAGR